MSHGLAFAYPDSSRYMFSETKKKAYHSQNPPSLQGSSGYKQQFFPLIPNNTVRIGIILIL